MSINILHIDDEEDVSTYLDDICAEKEEDIFIWHFETFDEGVTALKENPFSFNGIILDAKCLLNKEDGVFDEQNVIKTINEIEQVFRSQSIRLPYCILSGYKERLQRYIETNNLDAFDKNDQEEDALEYIIRSQSNVLRFGFSNKFPSIIEMSEAGLLLNHNVSTILGIYQAEQLKSTNSALIKAQISQVRPILERVLINLSEIGEYEGDSLVPKEYVAQSNQRITIQNLQGCFMYLNGKQITVRDNQNQERNIRRSKIMPDFISRQSSNIYSISSEIANHTNEETGTMHTLSMTFYSLIDILYWYKTFITNYRAQNT